MGMLHYFLALVAVGFATINALPLAEADLYDSTELGLDNNNTIAARQLLTQISPNANGEQIKWQPALDFDKDSCYNTAAISPSGELNDGLPNEWFEGGPLKKCRTVGRLQQANVYVRNKCNNNWCVYIYDYYFKADAPVVGHRHDWEHIAMFLKNRAIEFVATSQHGGWKQHLPSELSWEGTHPKIVYHTDKGATCAFRKSYGSKDEPPENHLNRWVYGNLLAWDRFPNNAVRDKLANHQWKPDASMAINDAGFNYHLKAARGGWSTGNFNPDA